MTDGVAPHLTVAERVALGRAARAQVSRRGQAELGVPDGRDAVALLEAQAATRVAELVPIRYGRMLRSPLAFFRGAAAVMAGDLSATPHAGLDVQLCGDAHLLNFGGFASPERDLVFDVNDFDETLPGPFEWDVKRLAASVEIAGRDRGLSGSHRGTMVKGAVRAYRETIERLARRGELAAWYARADAASLRAELHDDHNARGVKELEKATAKARRNVSLRAMAKLTHLDDGSPRIASDPPLIVPVAELTDDRDLVESQVREIFAAYRRSLPDDRRRLLDRFQYTDLAHKVVGIGSVGLRCWVLLLLGTDDQDPLFLQVKEAQTSALEPYLGTSVFESHAQRIVEGQRLAQAASDFFLGWTRSDEQDGTHRDFYVRQLRDWKASVDLDRIGGRTLATYSRWCGATLARAHVRSGDRIAIAAYLGKGDPFDRAIAAFAAAYADVNERDYASLREAVLAGRIAAADGL